MKRWYAQAFSVLEFLIYFLVILIIITVTMQWIVMVQAQHKKSNEQRVREERLAGALDCLLYDLNRAPGSCMKWKLFLDTTYIWSEENFDIGWELSQGLLWRSQGHYNSVQQRWTERTRSLVAQNISNCTLTLTKVQERIVEILITIKAGSLQEKQYVIVRNGKVL